ncbi:hypothetical protein CLV86_0489 [Lacinutrix venerupis]|uniref:hypothetical protein n=1 Tax=Lacinutrix venerupis TaxID=1486034 RepID=UPI000EB128B5|nr:hypothetical protein [Lacinutrix venerupis]RLJ69095.1 hypothetical protein CLV86_0489 [Lacinutrix venerupis]
MKDNRDLILEFLSENRDRHFNQMELKQKLFPELNKDQVKELLQQIIEYKSSLMRVGTESTIGILPVKHSGLIDDFLLKGGFNKIESDLKSDSEFDKEKNKLDLEIKLLQKNKLEYEETIREQNNRIRNLTEDLKFISLIQKYWWVVITCIGIGWSLGEILDKLGWT